MTPELVELNSLPLDVTQRTSGIIFEAADKLKAEATPLYHNAPIWFMTTLVGNTWRSAQIHIVEEKGKRFFEVIPSIFEIVDRKYTAVLGVEERQNNLVKVQLDDPDVWEKLEAGVKGAFESARDFPKEDLVPNE